MRTPSGRGARGLNFRLLAAGLCILLLAGLTVTFFSSGPAPHTVVVATRDIPAGATLQATDFAPAVIAGDLPNSLLLSEEEAAALVGRMATSDIASGALLQKSNFYVRRDPAATPGPSDDPAAFAQRYAYRLSEIIPAGSSVVVLEGDPTASYVKAGDTVAVFTIHTGSVAMLFTAKVLYAVPRPDPANDPTYSTLPTGTSLVLDTTPAQAAALMFAEEFASGGQIRIALVSPDTAELPITPELTDQLFSETYHVTIGGFTPEPLPSTAPEESAAPADGGIVPLPSTDPGASSSPSPRPSSIPGLP